MNRKLRDILILYAIPLFPVLFLGIPIAGTSKTITVPKIVLPLIAAFSPYSRKDLKTPGFLLFGLYLVWASVGTMIHPSPMSFWHLTEETLFILILVSVWTNVPTDTKVFWQIFRGSCLFVVAWAFLLRYVNPPSPESIFYEVVGTPNVAGAFLALAFLYSFHYQRYLEAACYLIGILVLGSMGAFIAAVLACLILVKRPLVVGLVSGLVIGVTLNVLVIYGPEPIPISGHEVKAKQPPSTLVRNFWANSMAPRMYIWEIATKAVRSNALLGSGLGFFGEAFLKAEEASAIRESRLPWWRWWKFGVHDPEREEVVYTGKKLDPVSSHSDVLRIATETGVIGGGLWLLAIGAFLWALRTNALAASFLIAFLIQGGMEDLYSYANYVPVLWAAVALEKDEGG